MINYGPHCNLTLYMEYGFVLSENSDDYFPLSIHDLTAVVLKDSCGRSLQQQQLSNATDGSQMTAAMSSDSEEAALRLIHCHGLANNLRVEQDGNVSWNVGACLFILASFSSHGDDLIKEVFECEDFFTQEKVMIKRMCELLIDRQMVGVEKFLVIVQKTEEDGMRINKSSKPPFSSSSSFKVAETLMQMHLQILKRASLRFSSI